MAHVFKLITEMSVTTFYRRAVVAVNSRAISQDILAPFIVALEPQMRLQRYVNPEYVQAAHALVQSHPRGSARNDVRLSGNFLDLISFCGTYFGLAPVQPRKHEPKLATVGKFGVDTEMGYYSQKIDPATGESDLERGIREHGERRMANGRINPVLGAGGKYVVSYQVVKQVRFMYLDFSDPEFRKIIDSLARDPEIAGMIPRGMSLSDLFMHEEAKTNQLLHRSMAAVLYETRHLLAIDGVIMRSTRGQTDNNTQDSAIICYWSGDNARLDWIEPQRVAYFEFTDPLPRMVSLPVDAQTDFPKLRDTANKADKR